MHRFLGSAIVTMGFLTICIFAHEHTDLNGTWTQVPTRSDFADQPAIRSGTVTINEREGNIFVSRNFVYEGTTGTTFYSDSIDSRNNATVQGGKELKSKARWDHDVLRVATTQSGATTFESYSLASDGTMMVRVEREDQRPHTLVFVRK